MSEKSLANLKPFKKGESGNPQGMEVGTKQRSTIVKKWTEIQGEFQNPITKQAEKMTVEDAMALSMIDQVITKGNVQAYNSIQDEIYGKLADKLDATVTRIEVIYTDDSNNSPTKD